MIKMIKKQILYLSLALVSGTLVGVITMVFGRVLLAIGAFRDQHLITVVPFLALSGLFSTWLYQRFGGESHKGMGLLFEVGHGQRNQVPLILVPLVMVTTWLTHLFGGSAGREGVAVQIGGTISHWIGKRFPYKDSAKVFLITGMAAGFAGLFQTPLAATFFALEILAVGTLVTEACLPAVVAAITASFTSHSLGLEKFTVPVSAHIPQSPGVWLQLALLGLCFGLVGKLFAASLVWLKATVSKKITNPYHRIATLSVMLSVLLLVLWQGRYTGLGTNLISISFDSQTIFWWDWFLKLALTVLTLSAGFQGGEVTPLFAVGASLGVVLAPIVGLPIPLVAALGYATVFGAATNTLLAPILIGGEVFGYSNLPYFVIAALVAHSLSHKYSIYSLQKR